MTELHVEFLYLDLTSCTRCIATDRNLLEAVAAVSPALKATGSTIKIRNIAVRSELQAVELRLATSPTIRINGTDIADSLSQSACSDCGDLCGSDAIDCRTWTYQGTIYDQVPVGLIVEALLRALFADRGPSAAPELDRGIPGNLKTFFRGSAE